MQSLAYGPVPDEQFDAYVGIVAQAFNSRAEVERGWLLRPEHRPGMRALQLGGRPVSVLTMLALEVHTGGPPIICGGLANVATPPEHRRQGYAASVLRYACDELRAAGVPLCMLHPFKQSFYQRLGWATVVDRTLMSGAPEAFRSFQAAPGSWEPVTPADIPALNAVYEGALRGRFGPIRRDAHWWELHVLRSLDVPYYAYLWRDAQGTARTYVIYQLENHGERGRALLCREAVALDPTARAQIFAFFAQHDSQVREVFFRTPVDAPVQVLMPDPLRCEVQPSCMLRLLDIPALLSALRYPGDASGRLTFQVVDDWLPANAGVYELEVAQGGGQCRRLAGEGEAQLRMNVRVLTQVATRYVRARTAAAFGLLDVASRPALALLDRLFTGLAPYHSDYF